MGPGGKWYGLNMFFFSLFFLKKKISFMLICVGYEVNNLKVKY